MRSSSGIRSKAAAAARRTDGLRLGTRIRGAAEEASRRRVMNVESRLIKSSALHEFSRASGTREN